VTSHAADLAEDALSHLATGSVTRGYKLVDHLQGVSRKAGEFASAFGGSDAGRLAGLWHDLGKYTQSFQHLIRSENGVEAHIEPEEGAERNHSSAGALHATRSTTHSRELSSALSFIIAGHHAGLDDLPKLKARLNRDEALLGHVLTSQWHVPEEILAGVDAALPTWLKAEKANIHRYEMWIRMTFSALCDGDFLDTESFYDAAKGEVRQTWKSLGDLKPILANYVNGLERGSSTSEVNGVRKELRAAVLDNAALSPGFFTLSIPTGGGKTLTGLEFAMHHASAHDLRRVVVAIPFTSIIEQNAAVYRQALGENAVLEHHSSVAVERETSKTRLASENWDAPIIVTTTVQLFESLFAHKTSACRKLHRLARSVIVLDEAQTLPPRMLAPILDALKTLVSDYGASVVFCTATQPAFNRRENFAVGIENARELVPSSIKAFERLRRVKVVWPKSRDKESWPEFAKKLVSHQNVLAIVHLRKDAQELIQQVDLADDSKNAFHLSALMCPAHRSEVLAAVKARMKSGLATRVIATQLIEAGVDIDFPVVYRAFAGFDSLAQAAGRCNREGKLSEGQLYVFWPPTNPPKGVLRLASNEAQSLFNEQNGEVDLFNPEIFSKYFARLYGAANLDEAGIQERRAKLMFREVSKAFALIENDWAAPVVVRWRGVDEPLARLIYGGANRETWRALQRFTVNVKKTLKDKWLAQKLASEIEGLVVLEPAALTYDERFGLLTEESGLRSASSNIIDDE
jgi:CRISPR-associated endonuclease/helicase Cas3